MLLAALIGILSFVGALVSVYFLLVMTGRLQPSAPGVPRFCRLEERTCATLTSTPQARLLGVPNAALGLVWYLILLLGSVASLAGASIALPGAAAVGLVVVAGAALLMSLVLTYQLLFVLRVPCPLCFTAHAINALVFLVLLLAALG